MILLNKNTSSRIWKYLKKNYIVIISFSFIFLIAIFLRTKDLTGNPPGFFADEASIGYNAYTLIESGTDEYGEEFPLFFRSFGEYKSPIEIYSTIPFIKLFGLNEFAVRLTSVFFGLLGIIAAFKLGVVLKNNLMGLFLATILSLSPWHIHISRMHLAGQTALVFFLLLSLVFIFKFFSDRKKSIALYLFAIACGIGSYTYFPARIIFPGIFGFTILILILKYHKKQDFKHYAITIIAFILLFIPLLSHTFSGEGLSRLDQVTFLNREGISPFDKFSESYLLHFSYDYLFKKGDIDMPGQFITRHSIRGTGELNLWELPLILIGVLAMFRKNLKLFAITIFMLLIYPITSSISDAIPPQATRSFMGVVPFTLLGGYGGFYLIDILKRSKLAVIILSAILISTISVSTIKFYNLFESYPEYAADYWGWQFGAKGVIEYFLEVQNNYDELLMEGSFNGSHIFLNFYDPENTCMKCRLGVMDLDYNENKKQLFAFRAGYAIPPIYQKRFKIKNILYYPNNEEGFIIGEISH